MRTNLMIHVPVITLAAKRGRATPEATLRYDEALIGSDALDPALAPVVARIKSGSDKKIRLIRRYSDMFLLETEHDISAKRPVAFVPGKTENLFTEEHITGIATPDETLFSGSDHLREFWQRFRSRPIKPLESTKRDEHASALVDRQLAS